MEITITRGNSENPDNQVLMGDIDYKNFCIKLSDLEQNEILLINNLKDIINQSGCTLISDFDFNFNLNIIESEIPSVTFYSVKYTDLSANEKTIILDIINLINNKI